MRTPADLRTVIQGTLCRQVTEKEINCSLDDFVQLLNLVRLHGHVPNEEFLAQGFPADTINHAGEKVHRLAGVSHKNNVKEQRHSATNTK